MLHHYNYSTSLTHFLNYQRLEEQYSDEGNITCDDLSQQEDPRCRSNASATAGKSFTIAAILGLKTDQHQEPINLETTTTTPSALPVRQQHHQFQLGQRQIRSLKHLNATASPVQTKSKGCKSKRVRTIFTPEQLERLEAEFERQQYMVGPERLYLAHTLQLTEAQVKVWFQNRRIKWRKHHLELTHQRLAALKQQQLLLDDHQTHADGQDTNSSETDT